MLGLRSSDVRRNGSPFLEKELREARNKSRGMLHPTEEIMSGHCRENLRSVMGLLLVAIPFHALGQGASDFSGLAKHINQEVTVVTPTGKVKGQLSRVEEDSLVVGRNGSSNSIQRDSIKKVSRHRAKHTAAWVGGMAAGFFGLGLLAGFHAFDDSVNGGSKIAAVAACGAGWGAGIGFALSRIGKDPVIYESSPKATARRPFNGMDRNQFAFYETQTRYLYRSCNLPSALCGNASTASISEDDLSLPFLLNSADQEADVGVKESEKSPAGTKNARE